jgi:hypothetical protein
MKKNPLKPTIPAQNPLNPFYIFVLKEGQSIQEDFLDYSLLLLQVGQAVVLPSPNKENRTAALSLPNLFKTTQALG